MNLSRDLKPVFPNEPPQLIATFNRLGNTPLGQWSGLPRRGCVSLLVVVPVTEEGDIILATDLIHSAVQKGAAQLHSLAEVYTAVEVVNRSFCQGLCIGFRSDSGVSR